MDATKSRLEEIAQDVRREMSESTLPSYISPVLFTNGSAYAAKLIYDRLQRVILEGDLEGTSDTPRIFELTLRGKPYHVTIYNGHTIDPTHSQFNPFTTRFVWGPAETYPLKVETNPKDVTKMILPQLNLQVPGNSSPL